MPLRDQIEQMKENAKYKKLIAHVERNKNTYMGVVGGFVVGGVVFHKAPQVKSIVDAYKIQINSPTTNMVSTNLQRKACPNPIPVRDKLTGEPYRSFNRAAKVTGEPISKISKDVHGFQERFERLPDAVFA